MTIGWVLGESRGHIYLTESLDLMVILEIPVIPSPLLCSDGIQQGLDLSPTSNKYKTRNTGFRYCTIGSGNSDIWRKVNKHGKHHNCSSFFSGKFLGPRSRRENLESSGSLRWESRSQYSQNSWVREPERGQPRQSMLWRSGKSCPYSLAENSYANVWEKTLKPSQLPVTCLHAPNESSWNNFQNSHKLSEEFTFPVTSKW